MRVSEKIVTWKVDLKCWTQTTSEGVTSLCGAVQKQNMLNLAKNSFCITLRSLNPSKCDRSSICTPNAQIDTLGNNETPLLWQKEKKNLLNKPGLRGNITYPLWLSILNQKIALRGKNRASF